MRQGRVFCLTFVPVLSRSSVQLSELARLPIALFVTPYFCAKSRSEMPPAIYSALILSQSGISSPRLTCALISSKSSSPCPTSRPDHDRGGTPARSREEGPRTPKKKHALMDVPSASRSRASADYNVTTGLLCKSSAALCNGVQILGNCLN